MPINGIAITSVAIGSLLIWSGVKGWNLLNTAGELITGKVPSGSNVNQLSYAELNLSAVTLGGTPATGSAIADDALKYTGHAYSFGGAPGKNGQNPWDCSSFVNWVIGHDFKHAIPGYGSGQYDGSVHGPPTGSWAIWPGLQHITASQVQAGDLIVWAGHMGIATSNTEMISALNSKLGTIVSSIAGFGNGPLLAYGRLK